MARETKAERVAREAAFAAAEANLRFAAEANRAANLAESYPNRLMAMLERAVKQNYELTVRDAKFVVEDRDARRDSAVELTLTYSRANQEALDELDWRVEAKEEAERQALYRVQVRNAALTKLSQEEREVLGL